MYNCISFKVDNPVRKICNFDISLAVIPVNVPDFVAGDCQAAAFELFSNIFDNSPKISPAIIKANYMPSTKMVLQRCITMYYAFVGEKKRQNFPVNSLQFERRKAVNLSGVV